jgi:hypothetical protein
MNKDLTILNEKIDQLAGRLDYLIEQARAQQRRNQDFEELKADLIPIGNQLVNLSIKELEEIGSDFELEDLLYLLKRMLRNTQLILSMMDRFEALMGMADEVSLLGKQVFSAAVQALDQMERRGLFNQAREMFDTLTRTDTLADLNRALSAFQQSGNGETKPPSLFLILKEASKPETRLGLLRLVRMLQALGSPAPGN